MKIRKATAIITIAALITVLLSTVAFAHSGRTDANGGHRDSSTGEYHYHHGYSAHDHYDMDGDSIIDCPYEFDDKTSKSSDSSSFTSAYSLPSSNDSKASSTTSKSHESSKQTSTDVLTIIGIASALMFFVILGIIILLDISLLKKYVIGAGVCVLILFLIWKMGIDGVFTFIVGIFCLGLFLANFLVPIISIFHDQKKKIKAPDVATSAQSIQTKQRVNEDSIMKNTSLSSFPNIDPTEIELNDLRKEVQSLRKINEALSNDIQSLSAERIQQSVKDKEHEQRLKEENKKLCSIISALLGFIKNRFVASERNRIIEKYNAFEMNDIAIPDEIYFINGFVPVKGTITEDKPFGDYTIYAADNGTVYHVNRYCGSGFNRARHMYDLVGERKPCKKCGKNQTIPDAPPDWYLQIKEIELESRFFSVNTELF